MKLSEIIKEYKDAFEKAYICTVVKELGVYGIAYNFIESELKKSGSKKLFDGSYKNDWADIKEDDFMEMKLSELVNLTDGDVDTNMAVQLSTNAEISFDINIPSNNDYDYRYWILPKSPWSSPL